ncbi:MAG: tyrosinase, partial [Solirubrobacteraceae bacterium]|nr:tyrosinase [Solirubrobacteraceae bacterium]
MTVQVVTAGPQARATLKMRESVSRLSAERLAGFRAAVAGLLARQDNRGYQYFAGWHGVPDGICQHHNDLFLPWHRGYLYHFELALQDIDPTMTMPWWNWLDEAGIPPAYGDAQVDGAPNVLFSAAVAPIGVPHQAGFPSETHREPFDPSVSGP